jgi:hypothetical protein
VLASLWLLSMQLTLVVMLTHSMLLKLLTVRRQADSCCCAACYSTTHCARACVGVTVSHHTARACLVAELLLVNLDAVRGTSVRTRPYAIAHYTSTRHEVTYFVDHVHALQRAISTTQYGAATHNSELAAQHEHLRTRQCSAISHTHAHELHTHARCARTHLPIAQVEQFAVRSQRAAWRAERQLTLAHRLRA